MKVLSLLFTSSLSYDLLKNFSPAKHIDREGNERELYHLHMESAELFGNSTEL